MTPHMAVTHHLPGGVVLGPSPAHLYTQSFPSPHLFPLTRSPSAPAEAKPLLPTQDAAPPNGSSKISFSTEQSEWPVYMEFRSIFLSSSTKDFNNLPLLPWSPKASPVCRQQVFLESHPPTPHPCAPHLSPWAAHLLGLPRPSAWRSFSAWASHALPFALPFPVGVSNTFLDHLLNPTAPRLSHETSNRRKLLLFSFQITHHDSFKLWSRYKFTNLTIFTCTVPWHSISSHGWAANTNGPPTESFRLPLLKLCAPPTTPHSSTPLLAGNHHSPVCECGCYWYFT